MEADIWATFAGKTILMKNDLLKFQRWQPAKPPMTPEEAEAMVKWPSLNGPAIRFIRVPPLLGYVSADGGRLFVNGEEANPQSLIRPGDVLTVGVDMAAWSRNDPSSFGGKGGEHLAAIAETKALVEAGYEKAMPSDGGGIFDWLSGVIAAHAPAKPAASVKPAMPGLSVTAPEDHRPGRWRAIGCEP